MSFFYKKKILITGHTGFKGSWLSCWLNMLNSEVFGLSINIPTNPSMYKSFKENFFQNEFFIDICDEKKVYETINYIKPDFIFHLAAQPLVTESFKNPINTIRTNAIGTCNILHAVKRLDNKLTLICITSDKVYFNAEWDWGYKETDKLGGKDIYSASKAMAENIIFAYYETYFKNSKIKIGITRAGNVIGGGDWANDRIVPDAITSWVKKDVLDVRNPHATRPWQHVLEPLSGYLLLAKLLNDKSDLSGQAFNFGPKSDQNRTVQELIQSLKANLKSMRVNFKEKNINGLNEARLLKLNCDKALAQFNWMPVLNFDETLKMTAEWYKEFYFNIDNCDYDMNSFSVKQIKDYINLAYSRGNKWINEL